MNYELLPIEYSDYTGHSSIGLSFYTFSDITKPFWRERNVTSQQELSSFKEQITCRMNEELRRIASNGSSAVISGELFYNPTICTKENLKELRDVLRKSYESVKILCYFRDQARHAESMLSTNAKQGLMGDIAQLVDDCTNNSFYDYAQGIKPWADVFGLESLTVRIYQEDDRSNKILIDFLEFLGATPIKERLSLPPKMLLNHSLTAFGRDFSQALAESDKDLSKLSSEDRLVIWEAFSAKAIRLISQKDYEKIYSLFNNSNVELAAKYLSSDCNPFKLDMANRKEKQFELGRQDKEALTKVLGHLLEQRITGCQLDRLINITNLLTSKSPDIAIQIAIIVAELRSDSYVNSLLTNLCTGVEIEECIHTKILLIRQACSRRLGKSRL